MLFAPPPITAGPIQPRPYQQEALEALDLHVQNKKTNPCVVIPTGGGKSILMSWAVQQWKASYGPFRAIVLAHRQELVEQNSQEMIDLWPGGDIGVYSAGLKRRDLDASITFASIDSVYNRAGEFPPFDTIIIDEAHRIPAKGEGKYRRFIQHAQELARHRLPVIGFTATPFRMGCGPICHKDHILNEVCYEANVGDLIAQGYLCRLRSKVGDVQPDLSNVRRNSGGDYITASLAEECEKGDLVANTVRSALGHIIAQKRKSVIFFCIDVEHCRRVSVELRKYGVDAPYVTAKTSHIERDRIANAFKEGRYKAICNVNVYTEGFNAKRVDCVVLLRPTLSAGMYVQMVGRGLRLHEAKEDCLVLDYANCILEHGPIDCLEAGEAKIEICGDCGDAFSRVIRVCPNCGWEIPKQVIEEREAAEAREKKMHEEQAANRNIIGSEPEIMPVTDVTIHRHRKMGKPDSIRVQYRSGISVFREWICLDHGGFAEQKARKWWAERFGEASAKTITVDEALSDFFIPDQLKSMTTEIVVQRRGKHSEIVGYSLNGK